MEFFKNTNYRQCIRWSLERLRLRGESVTITSLATAARVQSPYLSKVLSGHADLNADQLFLIAERLGLSDVEKQYFSLLLEYERAQVDERKKNIRRRADEIREQYLSPENQRQAAQLENSDALNLYYLDPYMQVVHMHLLIPKWRTKPDALTSHLGLRNERMGEILKNLEVLEIIRVKGSTYSVVKEHLHLPKTSMLCVPQQTLLRMSGMQRQQQASSKDRYSFAALFTANEDARREIIAEFSSFLARVEEIVKESPSEEVYSLDFDVFPWT